MKTNNFFLEILVYFNPELILTGDTQNIKSSHTRAI